MHPLYRAVAKERGMRELFAVLSYNVLHELKPIRRVRVGLTGGVMVVTARLKWWFWLSLGLGHLVVWFGLRRWLEQLRQQIYVDVAIKVRVR